MTNQNEHAEAYLDSCPETRNRKFQNDALDAFLAFGEKTECWRFFEFMRKRDWYCNGTFQMRCERNGLVFFQEGNECFVTL